MGREIRKVPPHYGHPINDPCPHWPKCRKTCYTPQYNENYAVAVKNYIDGFIEWYQKGKPKDVISEHYWDYHGNPPKEERYRKYTDSEATWFQVFETVSEGTPVTPPFATQDELVEYLATRGDFWDQSRGDGPWDRESAKKFVFDTEWCPSGMITANGVVSSRDTLKEIT